MVWEDGGGDSASYPIGRRQSGAETKSSPLRGEEKEGDEKLVVGFHGERPFGNGTKPGEWSMVVGTS